MSAISSERPAFPPQAGGAAHALRTAQSAFFRQAMGLAAPAAAEETARPVAVVPAPVEQAAATSRLQRPGSLLDIRV
ncbi:hypothetical protein ABC365_12595 [Brevundimonas sp. 3P9-tot-E]|uniref:hypothetical protein n=1 Tax=Brevundimonas TaxID=41275 RepID=UPI0019051BD5|nr:hypothetical protein [Brevundimonas diminuta]MBK1977013.1 hypothetical protein [Brevundimonas diminuta]